MAFKHQMKTAKLSATLQQVSVVANEYEHKSETIT